MECVAFVSRLKRCLCVVHRASHEQEQQLDDEAASPVTNGEETEPVVEQAEPVVDGPAADTATEHDDIQVTVRLLPSY